MHLSCSHEPDAVVAADAVAAPDARAATQRPTVQTIAFLDIAASSGEGMKDPAPRRALNALPLSTPRFPPAMRG